MATVKVQPDAGKELFIFGEAANIEYFIGSVEAITPGVSSEKSVSVTSHTRKRYIGDTRASTVSSHSRTILVDPGARNGNSLPGKPFVVEELNADGTIPDDQEVRQFTYAGTFRDLHAVWGARALKDCWLVSPAGKKYKIDKYDG